MVTRPCISLRNGSFLFKPNPSRRLEEMSAYRIGFFQRRELYECSLVSLCASARLTLSLADKNDIMLATYSVIEYKPFILCYCIIE